MDASVGRTALAGLAVIVITACGQEAPLQPQGASGASSAGQAPGESTTLSVLTHCGVESLNIDGRWWNAIKPLYGSGGAGTGPPAGWSQPSQSGRLTLETSTRARFEAVGQVVVLTPSETGEPLRTCR